ncbi:RICIN domain-containing protein [Bacillus cereus group sp. BfR-BA-01354]|uniref:RICIN domain-containing protein n=1 Tax=Bacillus cereus group TaxID=86661 RepID=UPI001F590321
MKKQEIKKLLFSKKVITGLFAGAIALSIWAPASQAATPEKNQYYSIRLKANQNLAWDVYRGDTSDNIGVLLYGVHNGDNQQFIFFPLDNGKYAIVNKNSGKPITVGRYAWIGGKYYWEMLLQKSWTGSAIEQWQLKDLGSDFYEIRNHGYQTVASYGGIDNTDIVDLDEPDTSDNNRVFKITPTNNTLQLPNLPAIGTRPDAPNYTGAIDQQLPQSSNSVIVSTSLVPSIMVTDNNASDYTKIHNSPYYILLKEEYWDKTFSAVIPAGLTKSYSFKTGITSVDQQKMTDTLSIKIGADLGLKFGDKSAAIKSEISRTIQTEISTTNTEASEETVSTTATSVPGKDTGFTEYQLATKYTLKRTDGSIVSDPWVVKNNKITIARKNAQ